MKKVVFLLGVLLYSNVLFAELNIEITKGADKPTVLAVVPFANEAAALGNTDVARVIENDMFRTGQFESVSRQDMLGRPSEQKDVFYRDWRALAADYLLIGKLQRHPTSGAIEAKYELFDVVGQKRVLSGTRIGKPSQLRSIAHAISDDVYEKLTGIRGIFSTKMLYISAQRKGKGQFSYRLLMADSDGERERVLLESREPIVTPTWSPDGRSVAYVSFESSRPAIYTHELATGSRQKMTNFKGLNSSPSWSPDGRRLAMVLSKDGSPDIYVMDIATKALKRVTKHFGIDTEPSWMPDGKSVIFTSDRGGKPQIYQVTIANGYVERLTFDGSYNARARPIPDGSGIIFVHRSDKNYHIASQDSKTGRVTPLTKTNLDESPSIAANGAMLLYATKHEGRGILAAVSLDGGVQFRLPSKFGDVREPAWSPFLTK